MLLLATQYSTESILLIQQISVRRTVFMRKICESHRHHTKEFTSYRLLIIIHIEPYMKLF